MTGRAVANAPAQPRTPPALSAPSAAPAARPPASAAPTAVPTCLAVEAVPPATPARSGGSPLTAVAVIGALAKPIPAPSTR